MKVGDIVTRILDLATEEDDDWLKKAYPGGIEKYRKDEVALHDEIQREHDEKLANKGKKSK